MLVNVVILYITHIFLCFAILYGYSTTIQRHIVQAHYIFLLNLIIHYFVDFE